MDEYFLHTRLLVGVSPLFSMHTWQGSNLQASVP